MMLTEKLEKARFSSDELKNYRCEKGRSIEFRHLKAYIAMSEKKAPEVMWDEDARWFKDHLENGCEVCSDAILDLFLYRKLEMAGTV